MQRRSDEASRVIHTMLEAAAKSADFPSSIHSSSHMLSSEKMEMEDSSQDNEAE